MGTQIFVVVTTKMGLRNEGFVHSMNLGAASLQEAKELAAFYQGNPAVGNVRIARLTFLTEEELQDEQSTDLQPIADV